MGGHYLGSFLRESPTVGAHFGGGSNYGGIFSVGMTHIAHLQIGRDLPPAKRVPHR